VAEGVVAIAREAYRQSTENLKSYMQLQWSLVGGNGRHVQGDGIRDKAGKGLLPFPVA
jgi:hypothetical protein